MCPSYEASFRTFSDNVILDAPLSGDAADDGRRLLEAIRHGRVFTVIDAIATPGYLDLRGRGVTVDAHVALPPLGDLVMITGGTEFHGVAKPSAVFTSEPSSNGAYRIEVRVPGSPGTPPIPWLLSNPVYFLQSAPAVAAPSRGDVVALGQLPWHVEKDPRSVAMVAGGGQPYVSLQYVLAPGARTSQFAAAAGDLADHPQPFADLRFVGSAARPSRISVQLRYASRGGERWGSSVYLDPASREIVVPVARLRPLDRQEGPAPDAATATSLLFVADLTNAKPGDSNTFTIANLRIGR